MLAALARKHPLVTFFTLAYWFAWIVFFLMIAFELPMPFIILASFGPAVAALTTHRLREGNWRAFTILGSPLRSLIATLAGIALMLLGYVVLPSVLTADPARLNWSILLSTSVYNYSTLLGSPLGEEFGWRGYALPRLEERYGSTRGGLILTLLWIGWHLPLFFLPGWTSAPFWIYCLILAGASCILIFVANLADFAVIPAILTHAMFNAASHLFGGLFRDTQPSTSLPFELVLAVSGLAVAVLLIALTRGNLGCSLKIKVLDKAEYSF